MSVIDERDVEARLVRAVADRGGLCLKLDSGSKKGIQDRLVLLPGARVVFVELKRPDGGRVGVLQKVRQTQIRRLGFESVIVKDSADLERFCDRYCREG
jgi:hypothetical protein